MSIKTRFCPSPTGLMHLGNYRTALLSWLLSKHNSGEFLLRIEDTDLERSQEIFSTQLQQDLLALDLQWDEGPQDGQKSGQYFQSSRTSIYDDIYQKFLAEGKAYPCFCSPEKLKSIRSQQLAAGQPPRYLGTCRSLQPKDVKDKLAAGMKASLRFVVPKNQHISFIDGIRGEQTFSSDDLGDFIIRKTNGTASFMFCNAVDDALMKVTHILRGEDHLTNTPRQILILQALGFKIPSYSHISIILGNDGSPLSKRNGSMSIQDLLVQGYTAGAINNYIARLGNNSYTGQTDLLSLLELAQQFDIDKLSKSAAKFDCQHLNHWQKKDIINMSSQEFATWIYPYLLIDNTHQHYHDFIQLMHKNAYLPSHIQSWYNILFTPTQVIGAEHPAIQDNTFYNLCIELLEKHGKWHDFLVHLKSRSELKGKKMFHALRIALTGCIDGPELSVIFNLIDKEIKIERLNSCCI
jgi:glutamyl-tRNA synthetase